MLISVDFWKSMHGFAMDSRTRVCMRIKVTATGQLKVTLRLAKRFRSAIAKPDAAYFPAVITMSPRSSIQFGNRFRLTVNLKFSYALCVSLKLSM